MEEVRTAVLGRRGGTRNEQPELDRSKLLRATMTIDSKMNTGRTRMRRSPSTHQATRTRGTRSPLRKNAKVELIRSVPLFLELLEARVGGDRFDG